MKRAIYLFAILMSATLMLSSCGKVPQTEMDAANAAVQTAKAAQADLYVVDQFNALQDSLSGVMASIETEKSKLFKNFKEEITKLTAITEQANLVKTNAETRKQEMKVETENLLAELDMVMVQNNEFLTKAPRGKEGAAALEAIKGELSVIEGGVAEAKGLLGNNDVINALNKATALKEKADAINAELSEVIAKYSARRR